MRRHFEEMESRAILVLKRHDVARAVVCGSFARGEMKGGKL